MNVYMMVLLATLMRHVNNIAPDRLTGRCYISISIDTSYIDKHVLFSLDFRFDIFVYKIMIYI